jgi:hypothetical protein
MIVLLAVLLAVLLVLALLALVLVLARAKKRRKAWCHFSFSGAAVEWLISGYAASLRRETTRRWKRAMRMMMMIMRRRIRRGARSPMVLPTCPPPLSVATASSCALALTISKPSCATVVVTVEAAAVG